MSEKYTDWIGNDKVVNDLKEQIKKAGTPLELRTKKFLKDNRFSPRSMRYLSEPVGGPPTVWGGVWRELDLNAFRLEPEIEIGKSKIQLMTHVIGDCKYSSDMDIIVFEHSDKGNVDTHIFPIKVNGQKLLPLPIDHYFKFPLVIEKSIHLNVDTRHSKEKGNYDDKVIHNACEDVLTAVSFLVDRWRNQKISEYRNMTKNSAIESLWQEELKSGNVEYIEYPGGRVVPNSFIDKFLREKFNPELMLGDFSYLPLDIIVPLIVFDENRGVIKARLDENNNIIGFDDVGFCLYPYISENVDKYSNVLENRFNFPIILSSFSSLDKVMEIINGGIRAIIERLRQTLEENPSLIAKELLFNHDMKTLVI